MWLAHAGEYPAAARVAGLSGEAGEVGVEFWRVFGGTDAAKPLVDGCPTRRAAQREAGDGLFRENQAAFRAQRRDEAYALLERILAEAPFTYAAYFAWKWLGERN